MRVMNVDSQLLRQGIVASEHAFEQTKIHIDAEIAGVIPALMDTLTPEGPYAYTIMPEVRPNGTVKLPILTTREEILEAYKMIRGYSNLTSVISLTEIRGDWYTFSDNISRAEVKSTGERSATQTLGLFPSGRGRGITGELIWVRVPRAALGGRHQQAAAAKQDREDVYVREDVFLLHERYMEALRNADVDGVLDTLNDDVASAVRDYVNDTGTLTTLEGKKSHQAYYQALFDRFDIRSVVPLDRVAEDWFVFAEISITVRRRDGSDGGRDLAFNTAEFHIPANDGRFIARIGHGTDPE
jgi:hypothetical protein